MSKFNRTLATREFPRAHLYGRSAAAIRINNNKEFTILTDILAIQAASFRITVLEDLSAEPKRASPSANSGRSSERRDVRRAIEHWRRNTWGDDCVPFLDTFDFSPMRGDWGYRLLLCGSRAVENSVFAKYGSKLAQLLRLPDKVPTHIPFMQQIPAPFRDVFAEGYNKAYSESLPIELKGTFSFGSQFGNLAVFLPLMLQPNWSKQLILGSFNCRPGGAPKSANEPLTNYNWRANSSDTDK